MHQQLTNAPNASFPTDFPSKRFYGGMLTDGPSVMERVQKVCPGVYARTSFQPFLLYDVENSREEDMNGSKYNRVEAAFCVSLCQNMFETCADVRNNKWSVGFVSPYKEQVRVLLRDVTWAALVKSARDRRLIIRSEGQSFPTVVKRLESDKYRELAEHYKAMHEKAAQKSAATEKASKAPEAEIKSVEVKKGIDSVKTNEEVRTTSEDKEKKANDVKVSEGGKVSIKTEVPLDQKESYQAPKQPTDSHKRPVDDSSSNAVIFKKPRISVTAPPTEADLRGQYEIRSFRDRSSSSTPGSRQRDGNGSHERATDHRPDSFRMDDRRDKPDSDQRRAEHAGSSRREIRHGSRDDRGSYDRDQRRTEYPDSSRKDVRGHDKPSRSRDYRGSHDRERGDRRSDNRYRGDGRRDRDNRSRYSASEGRSTSRSSSASLVVPQSISEKEFCQANEPLPPSKTDRMRSSTPRMTGKRPYPDSREAKYPPPHPDRRDRASASRSSYRTLSRNHDSNAKPHTGRSTNVLHNILGSAKKLASSTSRVNDKANPRSYEFS
ncbi:hypothetical protein GQ600_15054 [Phytophthora cactorum]|nr:hypothetical protein GQ600_15054 [Phytophthora cactorum]